MDETSTTAGDDPNKDGDAVADSTTTEDPKTATDQQTADNGDNLDPSKSTDDTSADGDKKPADDTKSDEGKDAPASTFDEDIDEWVEKRGLPKPETDEQKQEYQNLRNSQREFTREQQAKKDAGALGKAVEDAKAENTTTDNDDENEDPLEKRMAELEAERATERTTRLQSEFYTENKVTSEEGQTILEIFTEKVNRPTTIDGKKAALDYWSSPEALPDLLDIAKARLKNSDDSSSVADEAAREERERIAKESNASSTGRSAKNVQTTEKSAEDARNERLLGKYSS
jgi:hypothetical protein